MVRNKFNESDDEGSMMISRDVSRGLESRAQVASFAVAQSVSGCRPIDLDFILFH